MERVYYEFFISPAHKKYYNRSRKKENRKVVFSPACSQVPGGIEYLARSQVLEFSKTYYKGIIAIIQSERDNRLVPVIRP